MTGAGAVCLQGGAEFGDGGRTMDAAVLARAEGPVVVAPLASPPGESYRRTGEEGARWYRSLGAPDVLVAPDPREHPAEGLDVLRSARLVVLPGGSPARLLSALQSTGADRAVADVLADGGVVSGASAGAMVLCSWTVLPDAPGGLAAVAGLGVVRGAAVLPHWRPGDARQDWQDALAAAEPGLELLGLAEQSGVLVDGGTLTAVGAAPTRLLTTGRDLAPGDTAWLRTRP